MTTRQLAPPNTVNELVALIGRDDWMEC